MIPALIKIVSNQAWRCAGLQPDENSPVDKKRQHRISEHFGELQEQYLQMCSSHIQLQQISAVEATSVDTEQAAAAGVQPPQGPEAAAAVLHSDLMQPQQNGAADRGEQDGRDAGTPTGDRHLAGAAAGSKTDTNAANHKDATQSEERLDQLDCVLRTVTQVRWLSCALSFVSRSMQSQLQAPDLISLYCTHLCPSTN
jgi:hypothetical protein